MNLLEQGLKQMELNPSGTQLKRLETYVKELERWNPRYGLVNATGDELIIRHILDSLSACKSLASHKLQKVADIGSGAGLPGIPLAIMMENTQFLLVERSGKRCGFLRNILLLLGLKNAAVEEGPLEQMKKGLQPEGLIIAYKGRLSQVKEELENLPSLPGKFEIQPLAVPFLKEERQLVILQAS